MGGWHKKRRIMRRYDTTADIYDLRYEQEQTAKYNVAIESLRKKNLGLVLDAGCGTGLLFDHIKDRAETIVGLDISRKTLLKAKARAAASPNVHLIHADADLTPMRTDLIDYVFAITLIQNSPNPIQTLREIERVSTDEAVIVVTGLKSIFSRKTFERLLQDAGLRISTLKDEDGIKCYVAVCAKIHH